MVRLAGSVLVLLADFCAFPARAYVVVLGPRPKAICRAHLAANELERSLQGLRRTLESDDPTQTPPVTVTAEDYRLEALTAVDQVRAFYADIFRDRGMSPDKAKAVLDEFESEDRNRVAFADNELRNGPHNTVYFGFRNSSGAAVSMVRATLIRSGEPLSLPLETRLRVERGNRVELERAYNSRGPYARTAARELMMVMAKYFRDYFGSNDYRAYALTDDARARTYRAQYGFMVTRGSRDGDPMYSALAFTAGEELFERYIGHIEIAYKVAFTNPFQRSWALEYLRSYERRAGMTGYIPNLVAQAVLHAFSRRYDEAMAISRQLGRQGQAKINSDYHALWQARAAYAPLTGEGNGEESLEILHRYLAVHPLLTGSYNERALLFAVFELKILLGLERFEEARLLISSHRELLREGWNRQERIFMPHWIAIRSYRGAGEKSASRARLTSVELLWDLGTHEDPYAVATLLPDTYDLAARECDTLGRYDRADHFRKVAVWLAPIFRELRSNSPHNLWPRE